MLSRRAAAVLRRTATAARRCGVSTGIARAVAVVAHQRGLATGSAAGGAAPVKFKHSVYDIIVVGGGMVGSAFACALAANPDTRHLRVALLEAAPLHKHVTQPLSSTSLNPAPSIRVSSVTPLSALFLDEIGAWADMRAQRVTPFTDMQVWHSAGRGRVHWTAAEAGTAALGYIVENDIIQNSLLRRLLTGAPAAAASTSSTAAVADDDAGGVEVLAPAKVEALHPAASAANATNDWLRVTVGGETVSTRLLVGADGAQSVVKRFAGLSSVGWSYGQLAVVATVQHAPLPTGAPVTAWQRFLPDGPVAFLPCHAGYSNVVWSTTPAHAKHLCAAPVAQFVADLNSAFRAPPSAFQPAGVPSVFESLLPPSLQQMLPILFPAGSSAVEGARVDNITGRPVACAADTVAPGVSAGTDPAAVPPLVTGVAGPRLHFPLGVAHGTAYVKPRVALIGDSAHTIHPMAGQGVNLGFGDAQALARTVARAVHTGTDVGAVTLLREYERDRMAHNALMTAAVHGIKQLFEVTSGPFPALRGAGLDAFNSIPAIKTHASRVAMGLKAPTQA